MAHGCKLPPIHCRGQLAFSGESVITASTAGGRWVTPPNRAVWIPPLVFHETSASADVTMHSVFVRADLAATLPQAVTRWRCRRCCVR